MRKYICCIQFTILMYLPDLFFVRGILLYKFSEPIPHASRPQHKEDVNMARNTCKIKPGTRIRWITIAIYFYSRATVYNYQTIVSVTQGLGAIWDIRPKCISTLERLNNFSSKHFFYFLMLFPISAIFLYETDPIQWMFNHHCGYWWPGAVALGHQ